jgi:polygalacturonase
MTVICKHLIMFNNLKAWFIRNNGNFCYLSVRLVLAWGLLLNGSGTFAQKKIINILSYGAKAGLKENNSVSIQTAIDRASQEGGGMVYIPAGIFTTGPLVLKSGVELHLDDNALLLGSSQRLDYPNDKMAVISARNQHNIAVTGNGIIDGQGRELVENALRLLRAGVIKDSDWLMKRPTERNRTGIFNFNYCSKVTVKDVIIKNAANWVQTYARCDGVIIDHITVESTAYWNNDGIDIVDSKNVTITNSFINAADDGICLKSDDKNTSCDHITVTDCTVRSSASAFKFGTGSVGGFKNITVRNLTVFDTFRSAIALETVDGAAIENIDIRNVTATNTGNAIFIRLGHRNKDERYGTVKKVFIANVKAEIPVGKPDIGYPVEGPLPKVAPHNLPPAAIVGIPGHPVEDVTLENIEITYGGKADKAVAFISIDSLSKTNENIAGYPEFTMFGELPAYGLYVRHGGTVKLKDIEFKLIGPDFRPALVFDDVKAISLQGITLPAHPDLPAIVLRQVGASSITGVKPEGITGLIKMQ